jgi:hypothetical protein
MRQRTRSVDRCARRAHECCKAIATAKHAQTTPLGRCAASGAAHKHAEQRPASTHTPRSSTHENAHESTNARSNHSITYRWSRGQRVDAVRGVRHVCANCGRRYDTTSSQSACISARSICGRERGRVEREVSVDAHGCSQCEGQRLPTLTKQPCRNITNVAAALCSSSALKCRERTRLKMVWPKPQALFFHVLAWG